MKRQYMKPAIRTVELRQRHSLLVTSGETMQMYRGSGNQVTEEEDVW